MKFELPDLSRCCFCLPLRKGVIGFGYANFIYSAFMVGVYSYWLHSGAGGVLVVYHGAAAWGAAGEACVVVYVMEMLFNVLLLYGAHKQIPSYLRVFQYFGWGSLAAAALLLLLQLVTSTDRYRGVGVDVELMAVAFAGFTIQLYLLCLVRSLIRKLAEEATPHQYENQLHSITAADLKIDRTLDEGPARPVVY
ncbi:uncharacterized protein LOC105396428 [Plutella xylostella]|uniref:uncharacterized protein LOC105396428 n=1 Tax=Plutella xylostella TaxID=51655 RepID=UPI002032620B|nr:uncharacterized protein LOC105396428 [Plutella xylostella]